MREFVLHVTVENKKYAKSAISKIIMLPDGKVHYTKCSIDSVSSASIERIISNFGYIFTLKCAIFSVTVTLLSWYFAIEFSEGVLN